MGEINVLYSFPLRLGTPGTGMTGWYQVTGLLSQGANVTLYAGSCEKEIRGLSGMKETLVLGGIKLPIRPMGVRRACSLHDWIVSKVIERNHDRIDIVHCWPAGALQTLRTAKKFGVKTVLERLSAHTRYVYEVTRRECEKLGMSLTKTHYAAYNEKTLIREEAEFKLANQLLCPSEFVVKTFLDKGFHEEQLARHRYGYDPSVFQIGDLRPTGRDKPIFTIAFVGQCSPLKGLHFALKAWVESSASEKGRFYICGSFVPGYKELLEQYLVHPSVEYLGFVREVAKVMYRSDVLILPSLAEGSALVTYEARACGCVLLVSDAAGAHVKHMYDALVHKVGDTDSLREHIDMLALNRDFYWTLKKNSLAGLSQLTWEKAAEILVNIYRETLRSNSG